MNLEIMGSNLEQFYTWLSETGIPDYVFFLIFMILSLIIGQLTPGIIRMLARRFSSQRVSEISENFIEPTSDAIRAAGTLIFISLALLWLREYQNVYDFFRPFVELATIASVAWLVSRLIQQLIRTYGIETMRRMGLEVDELLLVLETVANIIIGFIAALAFAQSQNFNLIGLMASLGIGGLAIAFAAQKILEQLLSTIVLYLDRPFTPGDYIRLSNGQLGRVESIGLRSTKIRTSAKSTLFIVPNSTLIGMEIENVTRAKKVMVMLYLDFLHPLEEQDRALVQQVVSESTNSVYGIDPGSTSVAFPGTGEKRSRARVTFFILGSSENSLQLRKRLLELANENMSKRLREFGIEFETTEPTIYVDSPITL